MQKPVRERGPPPFVAAAVGGPSTGAPQQQQQLKSTGTDNAHVRLSPHTFKCLRAYSGVQAAPFVWILVHIN